MALKALDHFASLLHGYSNTYSACKAAPGPAALHEPSPSRLEVNVQLVAPSVAKCVVDNLDYTLIEDSEVPDEIASNVLSRLMSPLAKDVFILCSTDNVIALLVVLHSDGLHLVFKACRAQRAQDAPLQVAAELTAAEAFTLSPLMPTLVALSDGSSGGRQQSSCCSIMPYAGCSVASLMSRPEWYETVSQQDRLDFARLLLVQNLMAFKVMQETGPGYIFRDVKPENMCLDPTTGLVSLIDYGGMVPLDLEDLHPGGTDGYFTPEMVNPKDMFRAFYEGNLTDSTINRTTDVFLASYTALEVAVGLADLPWQLQTKDHDISTSEGLLVLLGQHADAAAAGYDALINRLPCPAARDFFCEVMCSDPAQRPTPSQALEHPWLAESKAAVQRSLATATAAYQHDNQRILDLFTGLPGVVLPQQQQQQQQQQLHQQEVVVVGSPLSAASLDVPCSTIADSSPERSSTPAASSCSSHDTAVGDELPAAVTAAVHKQRSGVLQRGKNLLASSLETEAPAVVGNIATQQLGASRQQQQLRLQ